MVRDIAIVSTDSSEPFLVLERKCRLDAEGFSHLAARSVNLVELREVGRQVHAGRTQIWRTKHSGAQAWQRVQIPSKHKIRYAEPHRCKWSMKRIIPDVPLADLDRPSVLSHHNESRDEAPVSGTWVEFLRPFELGD